MTARRKFAQERAVPAFARAEHLFELRAQPLDLFRTDVLRLRAEGAVDLFDGLRQRRMRLRRIEIGLRLLAAQLELEQPALCGIVCGDAVHVERADFGERGRQLDGRFALTARLWRA